MRRIALFVATTAGPVRVERITRERAPQSMVCLRRSSTVLPISAAYDGFVRPGSGVIERAFGPFEDGAFRLDVSAAIESGESWQLGVFVAHALAARAQEACLATEDSADTIIWLTGKVDCDLAVGPVGHVAEKIHASREAFARWAAAGRPVYLFVPAGVDGDAVPEPPVTGLRLIPVASTAEVFAALDLPLAAGPAQIRNLPAVIPSRTPARLMAGGLAAATVAAITLLAWPMTHMAPQLPPPVTRDSAPAAQVQPRAQAPIQPMPKVTLASVPAAAEPQRAPAQVTAVTGPKISVTERRAPAGHTCADVQFGAVAASEAPVAGEASGASMLSGLCGLGLVVDNGDQPAFVALDLHVVSGKLLYGTVRPEALSGQTSFRGRQEWAIDLPRRLTQPFEIQVTALKGDRAVAGEASWLQAQPDTAVAAKDLAASGIGAAILRHRVAP